MSDTRLPLVKEISDFFKSIEDNGHDLFSALEIVLDEEYDKALIDSCCDLKLENIKLEEAIRLCHLRFYAEEKFVKIGKATEKAFQDGYTFCFKRADGTILECMKNIDELLEEK